MKTKMTSTLVIIIGLALALPAGASMLVGDLDEFVDLSSQYNGGTVTYWTGSDFNDGLFNNLVQASETYEGAWLDGLLDNLEPTVQSLGRWQAGVDFDEDLTSLSLNTSGLVDWEYAVVKSGEYWAAYYDNDNSNILNYPDPEGSVPEQGISHITWFVVPVPPTVLLLGSGLICLLGVRRMRSKRS